MIKNYVNGNIDSQLKIRLFDSGNLGSVLRKEFKIDEEKSFYYYIPNHAVEEIKLHNQTNSNYSIIGNDILSWGLKLLEEDDKGNNTVIFTNPSANCPKGRISETFLELSFLKYLNHEEISKSISASKTSLYRFVKTISINSISNEPFFAQRNTVDLLDSPFILYYNNSKEKSKLKIPINLPTFLLEDFTTRKTATRRTRVKKELLQEWGILTSENKLTKIGEILLEAFESWIIREAILAFGFAILPEDKLLSLSQLIDLKLDRKEPISRKVLEELTNLEGENLNYLLLQTMKILGRERWRWHRGYLDVFDSDSFWIPLENSSDIWLFLRPGSLTKHPLSIGKWTPIKGLFPEINSSLRKLPFAQSLILLSGGIGEGKSVLLGQIALDHLQKGIPVFTINPERTPPEKWSFEKEVLIIIEDIDKIPVKILKQISRWLMDAIFPRRIVATIRNPLLNSFYKKLQNYYELPSSNERWGVISLPEWKESDFERMIDQLKVEFGVETTVSLKELLSYGANNPTCITYPIKKAFFQKRKQVNISDLKEPPHPYILKMTRLLTDFFVDEQGDWKTNQHKITFDALNSIAHQKKPFTTQILMKCLLEELGGEPNSEMVLPFLNKEKDFDHIYGYENKWWYFFFVKPANESFKQAAQLEKRISQAFFICMSAYYTNRHTIFELNRFHTIAGEIALLGCNYSFNTLYPALNRAARKAILRSEPKKETWGVVISGLHAIPTPEVQFTDYFPENMWNSDQISKWALELPLKTRRFIFKSLLEVTDIPTELPSITDLPREKAFELAKYLTTEDFPDIAFAKLQWAFVLSDRDQFEDSDIILDQIIFSAKNHNLENSFFTVRAFLLKGSHQKYQNNYEKARTYYEEALVLAKSATKETLQPGVNQELLLGLVYFRLGLLDRIEKQPAKAEKILEEAVKLLEICKPTPLEYTQVIRTLIEVKEELGKKEEAKVLLKKAISITENLKLMDETVKLLRINNRITRETGTEEEIKKGGDEFRRSLDELYSFLQFHPSFSSIEKKFMRLYSLFENNDAGGAAQLIGEILIEKSLPVPVTFSLLQLQVGIFFILGRPEEALHSLDIVIEKARASEELQIEGQCLRTKGSILNELDRKLEECETLVDWIFVVNILSKSQSNELKILLHKTMVENNFAEVEGKRAKSTIVNDKLLWKPK